MHLAWNLTQGHLFGATVSGGDIGGSILLSTALPDAPPWLTGGAFGPEGSVLALILISAVTAGALGRARRTGRLAAGVTPADQTRHPAPGEQRDGRLRTASLVVHPGNQQDAAQGQPGSVITRR